MSREQILANIGKNKPAVIQLKKEFSPSQLSTSITEKFQEMTAIAGAEFTAVDSLEEIKMELEKFDHSKKNLCSVIPELKMGNIDIDQLENAHDLESVDFAVIRGETGVAENGAIRVSDKNLKYRALCFITQHLVLVLNEKDLVPTMHEAYQEWNPKRPGFDVFIAGPSKTADIEQKLVVGAHGARSLRIFLIRSMKVKPHVRLTDTTL